MTEEDEEEDPGSMEDISRTARSLAKTGRYLRPIGERKPPSAPAASTSSSAPISGFDDMVWIGDRDDDDDDDDECFESEMW